MTDWIFATPTLILISGHAGVGKTTLANYIIEYIKENYSYLLVVKESFARGVKDTAKQGFNWDGEKDQKGRKLLQDVGRAGREYNIDLWATQTRNRIWTLPVFPNLVIIDDWRFPNEVDYFNRVRFFNFKANNVYAVRIEAPQREILKDTPEYFDVSETSLDNYNRYNYIINNSGSLEELKNNAGKIIELLIRSEKEEK